MNVEIIGTWAGLVWEALNASGMLTMNGLNKATKLKEKEIYAALGWLGREGKVVITETESEIEVVLC
ncbi:MAG: winged helix-turn-helix domain-containing protein [Bacteroidaceae bacterium]|nr:winged helix-turn-helix domain-containing protein [Bacteroidaceae bacterium]